MLPTAHALQQEKPRAKLEDPHSLQLEKVPVQQLRVSAAINE